MISFALIFLFSLLLSPVNSFRIRQDDNAFENYRHHHHHHTTTTTGAGHSTTTSATRTTSTQSHTSTTSASTAIPTFTDPDTPNNKDPQKSFTLDPKVVCKGFLNPGNISGPGVEPGTTQSLTSGNNFINFCAEFDLPLTNGLQSNGSSCNPTPMGVLPSTNDMPSVMFLAPTSGDVIKANQNFTVQLAVSNLNTGSFANADQCYYSGPQTLGTNGFITGHSHVVVQEIPDGNKQPLDPRQFVFFKGLNTAAVGDQLETTINLPPGNYRIGSITTTTNHVPVTVSVAQHGVMDDVVYFTAK